MKAIDRKDSETPDEEKPMGGSPATDPTNPWHQEAAGIFAANEEANERRIDEPGLTNRDRDEREAHA